MSDTTKKARELAKELGLAYVIPGAVPTLELAEELANKICERILTALSEKEQAGQAPVSFDYPEFRAEGMGCGLEDRNITDRYEAMRYGFDEAVDQMVHIIDGIGPLYTAPAAGAVPELLAAIKEYRLSASTTNRESVARLDAAMLAASKGDGQ